MRDSHLDDRDLLLLLDGEAPPRRLERLRTHAAACEWCGARHARAARVLGEAGAAEDAGDLLAAAAVERARLSQRLAAAAAQGPGRWWPASGLARAGLAAGVLLFVSVLGLGGWPIRDDTGVLVRPRLDLTPGATRTVTVAEICGAARLRQSGGVTAAVHAGVFARYGADFRDADAYELDYLITPELGGSDAAENLWPQPFSQTPWNAYVKDELELHLHGEVCAGRLDLATAQREIAGDWIAAYKRHFQTDAPRRDYAAAPVTLDDTALVLSELGETGMALHSSHDGLSGL